MKNIKSLYIVLVTLLISVGVNAESYPYAPVTCEADLNAADSCDIVIVYKTASVWYAVADANAAPNASASTATALSVNNYADKTDNIITLDDSDDAQRRLIWRAAGKTSKLHGRHGWLTVRSGTTTTTVYSLGYLATGTTYNNYNPVVWQLPVDAAGGLVVNTTPGAANPNLIIQSTSTLRIGPATNTTTWYVYRRAKKVQFDGGEYAQAVSNMFSFNKIKLPAVTMKHSEYNNYITFKGWSTVKGDASKIVGLAGGDYTVADDITLYAIYEVTTFTVTFDDGDHGFCETDKYVGILPFPMPEIIVDGGTYFKGWKLQGTALYYQPGSIYPSETAVTLTGNASFVAVYEHVFNVLEWKKDTVIIDYEFDADQVVLKTTNGTQVTRNLADCKLDIGIYQLAFNAGDLDPETSESMTLSFYKNSELVNQSSMSIPVIVTSDAQTSDYDKMTCAGTSLVIQRGATFTASGGSSPVYTFQDIFVYGGGKLVVPTGSGLVCNNIYMQGGMLMGATSARSYEFIYPQIVANGSLMNKSKVIYYDYLLNNSQMYTITLPYAVNTAKITYNNSTPAVQGTDFGVRFYDGAARSTGSTGWTGLADGAIMQPGTGYTIWGLPREIRIGSGEQITGRQKYAYLRLPMSADLSSGETTQNKTVSVQAHPAEKDNDAGWNLVGNPYLADFDGSINGLTNNGIGLLQENTEGDYDWVGSVRYIVLPNDNGTYYYPYKASTANLPAFKNFFVQIGSGDQLIFPLASRAQRVQAYRMDEVEEDSPLGEAGITLTRQSTNDVETVGVLVDSGYTVHYEIGYDLEKFINPSGYNLYAVLDDVNLSFAAVKPELAATTIPLELTVKYKDNYTFAIDRSYDLSRIQSLCLTDMQTGSVTNLLTDVYKVRFSNINNGVVNTISNRFYLSFIAKQPLLSDVDQIRSSADGAYTLSNQGSLYVKNLPASSQVYVYDASGRLLINELREAPEAVYSLPMGVYSVRIVSEDSNQLLRAIVR